MRRQRRPRHGDGTAWLVVDRVNGDYLCYWYTGTGEGHLVEHARAASAEEAVAWGRRRTPRVRIRTADARTYWAGTAPAPERFTNSWSGSPGPDVVCAPHNEAGSLPTGVGGGTPGLGPSNPSPTRDKQIRASQRAELVGVGHAPSGGTPC
jgi:hypothetical protein